MNATYRNFVLFPALALALALPPAAADVLHLKLGDPARKDAEAPLVLDAVTDTRTGTLITPTELAPHLADVRLLLVGENHTSMDFHRAQLRVIQELHDAGREVFMGLEMYPYHRQEHLDQWVHGLLTEEGFLQLSQWYKHWGYHWHYYRDIFLYARDNRIRMFGVNTPREVVAAVRKKGFENLSEEEVAHIPASIDTESEEHLQLFKAFFEDQGDFHSSMTEAQWKGMFSAQCTWDATMGYNAVQALRQHGGPDTIMVVLIGSGHVAYDLGVQRQARQWYDGKIASVIPIPIEDEDEEIVETVQASFADYLWGLPPDPGPQYPSLGVSTPSSKDEGPLTVIHVAEDSPAERAGFQVGDTLQAIDGVTIDDKETLSRAMSEKRWGDKGSFTVGRGEETLELEVFFRRKPGDGDDNKDEDSDE